MRRMFQVHAMLAVAATLGLAGIVSAQPPRLPGGGPVVQPPFSPYLNLLRRDNPAYLNYYGLVRPQQEFRQSIQTLRQDMAVTHQSMVQMAEQGMPGTGHRSFFMNTMGYFMTTSGGPGGRQMMQPGAGLNLQPPGGNIPAAGSGTPLARPPVGRRR
jgi:hypothetical protein